VSVYINTGDPALRAILKSKMGSYLCGCPTSMLNNKKSL